MTVEMARLATLALVALTVGWALLHRASRRPGWGYVGVPPTPLQVVLRRHARALVRAQRDLAEALTPALVAATDAMRRVSEALAATYPLTAEEASARIGRTLDADIRAARATRRRA